MLPHKFFFIEKLFKGFLFIPIKHLTPIMAHSTARDHPLSKLKFSLNEDASTHVLAVLVRSF